ncbi:DUF1738 domain-containing protein [Leptospira levettii]|uniref:ArdC family protein n=1 Tax=Leptospira levettii TaxID=2023178 RepID=UPI001083B4D7|nr:zincin-like metallopeptidase domain-containing protein [Leptospira levettii]TGM26144.1 DUF1738 domain-containing protein [Leptospira levettii]
MKEKYGNQILKEITEEVMAAIQSGDLGQWVKPWQTFGYPKNGKTKQTYGMFNSFLLTNSLVRYGFTYPVWATAKQWKGLGYLPKEGEIEKAAVLFPYHVEVPIWPKKKQNKSELKEVFEIEKEEEPLYFKTFKNYKAFPTFNIEQMNVPESEYPLYVTKIREKRLDQVASFVQAIEHSIATSFFDNAQYSISSDVILMPPKEHFTSEIDYWATYIHELGHWTGARHRLNRDFSSGKSSYAFEELVAELTSALFAGEFGLSGNLQHKEYIASWLSILGNYPHAIMKAGCLAMEAVEYLKEEAKRGRGSKIGPILTVESIHF